jgi:hypothetical protein
METIEEYYNNENLKDIYGVDFSELDYYDLKAVRRGYRLRNFKTNTFSKFLLGVSLIFITGYCMGAVASYFIMKLYTES